MSLEQPHKPPSGEEPKEFIPNCTCGMEPLHPASAHERPEPKEGI
jgi:hypothetical protein